MFNKKIRLRNRQELKIQNEGLVILKNLIEKLNLRYFLSSGTLLGAIREKDFIKWDWDVQMYLLQEEAYPSRNYLSEMFIKEGFIINNYNDSEDSLKWDLRRKKIKYELTSWYLENNWRYRKNKTMAVPSYLFDGEFKIKFRGNIYRTFNPPEDYLEFCYGKNWKIPKRTSNKSEYATSKHLRYNSVYYKIYWKILKILQKFIS